MRNQLDMRSIRYRRYGRKRETYLIIIGIVCIVLLAVLGYKFVFTPHKEAKEAMKLEIETKKQERLALLEQAERLRLSYDYDNAIALLETIEGYSEDEEVQTKITEYQAEKDTCVAVNPEEVTHIFYHTLVVDPVRAFANQDNDPQCVGNNQWMTTISEFNKITQEMYDRGFVMISIHDLEAGNVMLPPDKKAFVLSLDDLSYYHAYDGYGYATKLLLDENGKVMNEYTDADGNTTIGAYDVVPLMDQFVEEHPDASYRGAKGIIALTGYNGVLGYRTDVTYDYNNDHCDIHQRAWMDAHPDFSLEKEREQAKLVADAMKANGWEFASHTWGHVRVGERSLEALRIDHEKWKANVVPIVGETDTIIFAHGQDLQGPGAYSESNAKYQYFREQGFDIFCNVDSNTYTTYMGDGYMRQGRRNLDGYRIYKNATGQQNNVADLFDAKEIIDPQRPPVPEL